MSLYHRIRPLLFRLAAERAHSVGVAAGRSAQALAPFLVRRLFEWESDRLETRVFGVSLPNPFGLAAGFDKNGVLIPFWHMAGFGHVEIGSVSAIRCRGNPRPRAFRLPVDEALINRMGLNNQGAERIAKRLRRLGATRRPVAVSLVKTHDPTISGEAGVADFVRSFRLLAPRAGWVVLNLSCPNTDEGKTFEDPNALDDLLQAIFAARAECAANVPVLLKLSPPVSNRVVLDSGVDEIVTVALSHGVSGFVACNTAPDREGLETDPDRLRQIGNGGVSGAPVEDRSTHLVRYLFRKTGGRLPIVGVGGVASGAQAYRKIRAGASLVQMYTGLVYHGPGLVRRVKEELHELLISDGFAHVADAVGIDA